MKQIKQYGIFLFLLVILSSCSNRAKDNNFALSYWSSSNNSEIEFANILVDNWNSQHPDEKIQYQPVPEGQSSEEIILAAVVGKTTSDIYSNMWQGSVEFYAKANILVALDTLPGFIEFIYTRCDSATISEITSNDGHIYQIPWKINPIMTLYNHSAQSDLGIDKGPLSYSKFLEAAEKFKKDTDGDGYIDQWLGITSVKTVWYQRLFNFYPLYLAASNGIPLIETNKAAFNNEHAIEVFQFLQDIYKNDYFSKEPQAATQDKFISRQVVTKFTGSWEIKYLEKFKPEEMDYDFTNIPVPDDHEGPIFTYCDPKSIVIFNTCENPQLAFDFIKTMIDTRGDSLFLALSNQLPRRSGIDTIAAYQDFFRNNPKLKVFAQQAKHVKGIDNCEVITEVLDIISQEYEACVLYNLKSPEKAINDAEKAVNVLLRAKK
ncbi:MAG: extracellular solute-binding protein [Bacteroidales bacterium]|nr:extracellular solute-binding protein [Bacteroidales bacterium]